MFNVSGPQIPWSLFGLLNTELRPPDLPEGLSPDNQDVAVVPGEVRTRPSLNGVLETSLGPLGITYQKTFIQPNNSPLQLILTSDGILHMQDISANTAPSSLQQTIPEIYASSVTAFGREYIAFHDGNVGQDIPRQYDPSLSGTGVRRISQDGCAVGPSSAADAASIDIPISTITPLPPVTIVSAVNNNGVVTITTATAHGLVVNDDALISGNSTYQFNGPLTVATVPSSTTFTYNVFGTGWTEGTGGTVIPSLVTVVLTESAEVVSGDSIVITGNSDSNYNNSLAATTATTVGLNNFDLTFYPYNDSNGGAINYTYPGQGFNEPLPGPVGSFTLSGTESIFFNPNVPYGPETALAGAPSLTNAPLNVFGLAPTPASPATWDGTTEVQVYNQQNDFVMVGEGSITVSAAGSVTFQIIHKEGAILGIGGGATPVSGEMNDAQPGPPPVRSGTCLRNYPIMYMNNGSTEFYGVGGPFNQQFTVNFPAPGTYPIEIDFCQWHHSSPTLSLRWQNSVTMDFQGLGLGTANVFGTPPTWTVDTVLSDTTFTFNAVYAVGTGTGGTCQIGGLLSPGIHQVVCMFLTDTDYLTIPSPPIQWASAGAKRVTLSDCPIGPSNCTGRYFAFTGANGDQYFYIPVPVVDPSTGQVISTSTVINDNTTTEVTFDFSDNTLFAGEAIDITGNNLFAQVVLGTPANVFSYSNRLVILGDTNKIQNLQNMGFEGGIPSVGNVTSPNGWTVSAAGGSLVTADFGNGWQIQGNGQAVARGMITQPAYQTPKFTPILTPSTQYTFRTYAYASLANMTGTIVADLYSPTSGVLAQAQIDASSLGVSDAMGAFVSVDFDAQTPVVIPSDTIFRVYGYNLSNNANVVLDEMQCIYTASPITNGQARVSYALNPEAFDGVTGLIDILFSEALLQCQVIRDNLYILSSGHISRTQDNGVGEPITWPLYTQSDKAGGLSLRSFDTGEGWGVFASLSGLYMFFGGEPVKISQEIQTLWAAIDPTLLRHIQVKNDTVARRCYVSVPLTNYTPTNTAFTPDSNNKILVVDYRELNSAAAIENAPPLHISMTGKMLSSDLTRKWTVWNVPINCMEIVNLHDQTTQMTFGSGKGNGLEEGFGNFYTLDDDESGVDQDYGPIGSLNGQSALSYSDWLKAGNTGIWRPQSAYYVTYFAPSHEQEQSLQIGSQRKIYEYVEAYIEGTGQVYALALLNNLSNPIKRAPKPRTLSDSPNFDLEWPLNAVAQRMALLFYAQPGGIIPGIQIIPSAVSVSTYNTEQFAFVLLGTPTQNVTWTVAEAGGGTISSSGLYTAPSTAGTYHVQVASADSPTTTAIATVTVHGGYDGDD